MSDTASNVGQTSRSARDLQVPHAAATAITAAVIALCLVACALTFLLPADSLIVDLVYQGF